MSARIEPGTRREVGLFAWTFAEVAGRVAKTEPPRLFLTMARRPALFRGWLRFAARLMPRGRLPRHDTELVILRVAHLRGCSYEFEHHARLAGRFGVDAGVLEQVRAGSAATGWTERERILLRATELLHETGDLDDATWAQLRDHLDEADAVEFVLLVGHYELLATFLLTLRIAPDRLR